MCEKDEITLELIRAEYKKALDTCQTLIPLNKWKVKPDGISITNRVGEFGSVNRKGEMFISKTLLGTTAISKLRYTLRHEFAHLVVGLHHNHNKVFKRCEAYLLQGMTAPKEEVREIYDRIEFKWSLYAKLINGKELFIGHFHKKNKKYTQYRNSDSSFLGIKGQRILSFEYRNFQKTEISEALS